MKKIMTIVAVLAATFTYAQKEGSIFFTMTFEGLPAEQAAMMGDMETKVYFKDKKSYSETNSMMFSSKTLSDENGMVMLQDQMGNKICIKKTKAELEKEEAANKGKEPKIEYTTEKKTIAGYECKKAIVTIKTEKDGDQKSDVWYCEKIPYVSSGKGGSPYKGIKGMPLEFSFSQGPMKIKMVAKEVSLGAVPDSKFVLSTEGYKELTPEDIKNMQGGKDVKNGQGGK